MDNELLTVEQAAQKIQINTDAVRRLLREKTLQGVKMGPRQWRIPASAVRDYINGQVGKPSNKRSPQNPAELYVLPGT